LHEGDEPDPLTDLRDAEALAGEDMKANFSWVVNSASHVSR
jgi:hypothetical protein